MNLERFQYDSGKGLTLVMEKHGTHDQSTHGSWANQSVDGKIIEGKTVTSLIDKLSEKKTPGFTIELRSKTSPKDGFMASDSGAERTFEWSKVSESRATLRSSITQYIRDHADLLDGSGAFFGAWVDEGTLYLDVSRRYASRSAGVSAGFRNQQKAIYDVANDSYIYMEDEVDEQTTKARFVGDSKTSKRNDRAGVRDLRRRNNDDFRKQVTDEDSPHICLGRYPKVEKHLEGQHDQSTHGSWASGRFGPDSLKSARDGAKEYAFKAGIEQDDSIDYQKTVANRARAARIADAYDELPIDDPKAYEAYTALATEVEAQFDYMTKTMGMKVEFVDDDPYKTSREMFADASKGSIKVLRTASTGSHPFFTDDQNDKFRAVHDFFGHAATGRGFGQDGEESAWVHHSQMFTMTARAALTTETRGQNSWYNTRNQGFAEQKVALLPEEFWQVPKTFEKSYKVIRFQAGLIPILKHQEHDQSTHGSWANQGYSQEEQARISEMSSQGPALADLDAILDSVSGSGSMPGMDDLRLIVENDQGLYLDATEDIDARVEERLARLQEEFPNHEYTEQEKATIYEDTQREMIDAYIDDNSEDLQAEYAAGRGEGDTESLLSEAQVFFEDVYNTRIEVKNPDGGESGYLESVVTSMDISDHPYDGSQNAISIYGSVLDSNGDFAGEFERTFFKENGEWQVEHDLFKIEDEYRGLGFGKDFLQRSEDWYTAVGVQNIELGTGWEGARHWARAGFDFNERYQQANMNSILSAMNTISEYRDDFKPGSPERIQFDALMSRATVDYVSDADGGQFTAIRSLDIPSNDVPIPNDFAMLGYADRTPFEYTAGNGEKRTGYTWAGERLLQDLNLKYKKSMTAEGRSLNQGPIDRDGDGMVYDGTPREKPASAVNS
jgi:hypothetical protein